MRFSGSSSQLCWASGAAHGIPPLSMRQWARKILTDLMLNLISDYLDVNTCIIVIAICPVGRSPKQQQFIELQIVQSDWKWVTRQPPRREILLRAVSTICLQFYSLYPTLIFGNLCGKFNYLMNFDLGISSMVWYLQLFLSWKEKKVDKKWFEETGFNPH